MNDHKNALQMCAPLAKPAPLMLSLPFDIAHIMYALVVRCGLAKDSMLASARFSRDIGVLEKLTLGPWARKI